MARSAPGARWRQLREEALSSADGKRNYGDGYRRAVSYQQTTAILDTMRRTLGVSRAELARRLERVERAQPSVARLLDHGETPTLASLEEALRALR